MIPPTATQQEKKITMHNGKPLVYEPANVKTARSKLEAHLSKHAPKNPITHPLLVHVKWLYPAGTKHENGEYKETKPDLDNLSKMLLDVMTKLHFWKDDSLIVGLVLEKFWAATPGIYISIDSMEV